VITAPHQLEQQIAAITAERDALYDALERLVRERKAIEFATPGQQASLRNAKALLAEVRRSPKEPTA
jgi:hypothetical protein